MAEGEHVDPASPGARGGLSSLFENYLKMSRFNLTETELLNKCLIQKNVTPSVPLLAEHSVLSDELLLINGDITEVDEEKLLQDLDGDSDFSETVSEFSSLSLTNSKLKCRRRDRWVRARQKKESISKTPLIHKISNQDLVNHKTLVMEHEYSEKDRHQEISKKTGESNHTLASPVGSRASSAKSTRSKSSSPKLLNNSDSVKLNTHDETSTTLTSSNNNGEAKDAHQHSWSAPIESSGNSESISITSDEIIDSRERTSRSRSKKKKTSRVRSVSRGTSSTLQELDEKNLGRNMRAIARKKRRKLRT